MDPLLRTPYNRAYDEDVFERYRKILEDRLGPFPFRLAETPLFMTEALRTTLARHALEIVTALAEPKTLAAQKKAVPAHYDVPGMDALPNCVQVDFALTPGEDGKLVGKVVELQGFPSLYVLESAQADAWSEVLSDLPDLPSRWSCFFDGDRARSIAVMKETILGGEDPEDVVLVDYEPEKQKTYPDFVATKELAGVDAICVTKLVKQGKKLFREKGGRLVPVKRIYNRMVFDELEAKNVKVPFSWTEELDVTWCSHPNWYWTWSKYSLPYLSHAAVPVSRFLSEVRELPEDLARYVLKPLFSFAGSGVVVDVTSECIAKIPKGERGQWILQEKIEYAPAITMPDGNGVKAEVRVMLMRPPAAKALTPLLCLVRLSRGKMLGVDYNRDMTWVGGSVGMWSLEPGVSRR